MSESFYDRLGVDRDVAAQVLRQAYAVSAKRLSRKRTTVLEQQGDPQHIDHARALLDEAWAVLGDPQQRAHYDAMLAWSDAEVPPKTVEALWERALPHVMSPSAAVGLNLLKSLSGIQRLSSVRIGPRPGSDNPTVVPLPTQHTSIEASKASLQIVNGTQDSTQVIVLNAEHSAPRVVSSEDLVTLVDRHGYSGALLRELREQKGITIEDLMEETRISEKLLRALENEDRSSLPSTDTFVQGYLRSVGRVLGLDEESLAQGYFERFSQ